MTDLNQIVLAVVFSATSWTFAVLANHRFAHFAQMPSAFAFGGKTVLAMDSRAKAIFRFATGNTLIFATLIVLQIIGVEFFSDVMGLAGIITLTLQLGVYVSVSRWAKEQPQFH